MSFLGKNDGSVKGVRYFSCAPKHGKFVRPDKVMLDKRGRAIRSSNHNSFTASQQQQQQQQQQNVINQQQQQVMLAAAVVASQQQQQQQQQQSCSSNFNPGYYNYGFPPFFANQRNYVSLLKEHFFVSSYLTGDDILNIFCHNIMTRTFGLQDL